MNQNYLNRIVYILFFIVVHFLISCASGLKVPISDVLKLDKHFSGTFSNTAYKIKRKTIPKEIEEYYSKTNNLLPLFYIQDYSDSITLEINAEKTLLISFREGLTRTTIPFKGKLKKRYYEIFFSKKRLVIPIFYSSINIARVRIGLTNDSTLIIDSYSRQDGHILLLPYPMESIVRGQYFFKKITDSL
jgi:hypothetical protein